MNLHLYRKIAKKLTAWSNTNLNKQRFGKIIADI